MQLTLAIVMAVYLVCPTSVAHSQVSESGVRTLAIYQHGQTLVTEFREVNLDRGRQQITLRDLPENIDYQSLILRTRVRVHDHRFQNFYHDMNGLMRSLIDNPIRLEHPKGVVINGILRSFEPNLLVLELQDGSNTMLPGLSDYIVSSTNIDIPDYRGPALTLTLEQDRAGKYPLELNYLLNGLSWSAEYAMIISADDKHAELSGWSMIHNRTGNDFRDAEIHLIAGEVNTVSRAGRQAVELYSAQRMTAAMMDAQESVSATDMGDLKRFPLLGRLDINAGESRRVSLTNDIKVGTQLRYRYTSTDRFMEFPLGGQVRVQYDILNDRSNGLGVSLPGGTMRMYKMDENKLMWIGEDRVGNTSVGGTISVTSGLAFDLLIREIPRAQNRITDRIFEQSHEIELINMKTENVTIEVDRVLHQGQRVTHSSLPYEMVSSNRVVFKVPVNREGKSMLTFTLRTER